MPEESRYAKGNKQVFGMCSNCRKEVSIFCCFAVDIDDLDYEQSHAELAGEFLQ